MLSEPAQPESSASAVAAITILDCCNRILTFGMAARAGAKDVVRTEGLEPSRDYSQGILSPLRLPFRHVRNVAFPAPRAG